MTSAALPPVSPTSKASQTRAFLKWAGGKTQLIPNITEHLPHTLSPSSQTFLGRYFEPFMGSAALFFHLSLRLGAAQVKLSDTNLELVLTFKAVRDHLGALLERLAEHERAHNGAPDGDAQRAYYYSVRALDRSAEWPVDGGHIGGGLEGALSEAETVMRAARFIYLNRTCFNGLWRVNRAGQHNVPMGRYKNPVICNPKLLEGAHRALQGVCVQALPFEVAVAGAGANDVVYFDPPYVPRSATSSFNAYAKDAFDEAAHQKLAVVALALAARGARVVLSNSDTPFTRAPLGDPGSASAFETLVAPIVAELEAHYPEVAVAELLKLYRTRWRVETVYAARAINAVSARRGVVSEILVSLSS